MLKTNTAYRSDIDGLRALSVIAVFIFHIKAFLLPGGFVGVDVFFVISGYLITSQIYREISEKNFSLAQFYMRRLKRIQPVMWFVILVVYIAALFIFIPTDMKFFADSIRSVLSFSTNFFFAKNTDYFNPNTEQYPLLHFWSLAVEEQFYLFWPSLLIGLNRLKSNFKTTSLVILILSLASFIGGEIFLRAGLYTKMVYFLLPSRLGELGLGGLLGILHLSGIRAPSRFRHGLSLVGLAIFIYSVLGINKDTLFPGLMALPPCLAALFLIEAGPTAFVNQALLNRRFVVHIGQLSYSIYLWHYPILAFMKYLGVQDALTLAMVSMPLSYALSYFSKNQIEDRFRKINLNFKQALWRYELKPVFACLLVVITTYDSGGLPQRYFFSKGDIKQDVAGTYKNFCHQQVVGDCKIGDRNQAPETLITGDSHAGHFIPFWDQVGLDKHVAMTARSSSTCAPVFKPMDGDEEICLTQKKWFHENYQNYKTVVLGGRWDVYLADHKDYITAALRETLDELKAHHIHVIVMLQSPKFDDDEYNQAIRKKYLFLGLNSQANNIEKVFVRDPQIEPNNKLISSLVLIDPLISVINPVALCPEIDHKLPYRENGMAYTDSNHINEPAARILAECLIQKKAL